MNDLFGEEPQQKRKGTQPFGYASDPGTGPAGETCGTCLHAYRAARRRFAKCAHPRQKPRWTHGIATDIRLGTAACRLWESAQ